jgi:acyl carrier protein
MEHFETIKILIVENFLFGDADRLQAETPLLESGILDSTGVLELIGHLESMFGIRIEDGEITPSNLNSLKNICEYVSRKLSPPKTG